MPKTRTFTEKEAKKIGERIGINWKRSKFEAKQLRMGLHVELEHGKIDPRTNVSDDDIRTTGRIAWAHLNEFPDYYTRLSKMEKEADRFWANKIKPISQKQSQ